MRYVGNSIAALLTPWGRLSAVPFAVMAILLIAAHTYIQIHLTAAGDSLPTYNSWSVSYFVIMWVMFCIVSRRFHDAGKTAFFLVPLLFAIFASYLYYFDNMHFADSDFAEDRAIASWAEHIRLLLQFVTLGAIAFATLQQGDYGDNAFGPEFGKKKGAAQTRAAPAQNQKRQRRAARQLNSPAAASRPQQSPPPPRREFEELGPRGRITPAGLTGSGRNGFGRR